MTTIQKYSSVKGSLQSQANKLQIGVAQAFLDAEIVVLVDVSASMTMKITRPVSVRHRHAMPHATQKPAISLQNFKAKTPAGFV